MSNCLRIESMLSFFICYANYYWKMISKDINTIFYTIYELQYSRMLIRISMIKSTNVNDISLMWTISEVKSRLKFVNGNIIVAFNFMEMTDGCFISKIESVMKFRCENLCFITAYRSFPRLFVIWCASWHFFRIICV